MTGKPGAVKAARPVWRGTPGKVKVESDTLIRYSLPLARLGSTRHIDLKLDLNSYLVKRPCSTYYAKVSGDSMTGAGILDGDLIVVDRSQFPAAGKIVVVALNGEITVKRIQYQQEKILLCPENDKYQTIALDSHEGFEFYGVVIGIIRKL